MDSLFVPDGEVFGPRIGLRCRTDLGHQGGGLAASSLYDTDGSFGRAEQSLFVNIR